MNTQETTNETARQHKVIVVIGGREEVLDQSTLGLTMESTERQVLDAVQGVINESLQDDAQEYSYTVRKMLNTSNLLVMPKPVAGSY